MRGARRHDQSTLIGYSKVDLEVMKIISLTSVLALKSHGNPLHRGTVGC